MQPRDIVGKKQLCVCCNMLRDDVTHTYRKDANENRHSPALGRFSEYKHDAIAHMHTLQSLDWREKAAANLR